VVDITVRPHESGSAPDVGILAVFQVECRKLRAQLSIRLVALVAVLGPVAYVLVLHTQSGAPVDSLLGVWAHSSGFAAVVVLLVFAGSWAFPVVAGLTAGDVFAAEDRLGTWKTVLTRACTRRELFVGKVLAAAVASTIVALLAALASIAAALLVIGDQPLVGLSGNLLSPGRATLLILAGWVWCLLPLLAFTSVAVLFSVATASSIGGVLGPILVGLAMQLLGLVGSGLWMHLLLVGSAFDAWHGLLHGHVFYGPLIVSTVVSVVWIVACLGASWLILRRREFAGSTPQDRTSWPDLLRVATAGFAVLVLVALACGWGPTGVTRGRLDSDIGATFRNLTLYQQRLLGRAVPANAPINALATCSRRSHSNRGAGDDWLCTVDVFTPGPQGVGIQETPVSYEVSVKANGCYTAGGPPAFIGARTLRDPRGRQVVNPLFVFYGCFPVF
jgi:ABC-2 type transport system permease protein